KQPAVLTPFAFAQALGEAREFFRIRHLVAEEPTLPRSVLPPLRSAKACEAGKFPERGQGSRFGRGTKRHTTDRSSEHNDLPMSACVTPLKIRASRRPLTAADAAGDTTSGFKTCGLRACLMR